MLGLYIVSTFYWGPPKLAESELKLYLGQDRYDLRLIGVENHAYALYYGNHGEIAAGSKEWLTDLQDFHQHFGHDLFVKEVFNCLGSWDPSSEIKALADDAYEQLDMVCLGGIVYKPGHCMVCRQLVI